MSRNVNQRDLALSGALAERDIDVHPRALEDWRQAGMLEASRRRGRGRGRGSESVRPDDEVDRAEYMARLLGECGSYANTVLVAYVQDIYPIPKDRLEAAYEQSLGRAIAWIDKCAGPAPAPIDTATRSASKLSRPFRKERAWAGLRERVRQLGQVALPHAPMHRVIDDVIADIVVLVRIGRSDERLTVDAADSVETLIVQDAEPVLGSASEGPKSLRELAINLDLGTLVGVVKASTMDELNTARDNAKTYRAFARAFAPYAQHAFGTAPAFGWLMAANATDLALAYTIPAFVLVQRLRGPNLAWTTDYLARWTPFFAAAADVLDQLPAELRVIARPGGYDSLTPLQREELKALLLRLETTHPEKMQLLTNPPVTPELLG